MGRLVLMLGFLAFSALAVAASRSQIVLMLEVTRDDENLSTPL